VMSRSRNQIAGVLIAADPRLWRQIRVVTQIEPNICAAVDQSQVLSLDVPATIFVVVVQLRRLGNAVILASREGPCTPRKAISYRSLVANVSSSDLPLLSVILLQNSGNQRGAGLRGNLVSSRLGASGVKIRAGSAVCGVCIKCLVLSAEAATVCAINAAALACGEQSLLDVIGIATQTGPGFTVRVVGKQGIYAANVVGRVWICNVRAEVPEIVRAVRLVPVELLPGVRGVVHRSTNGKGDGHGKVF
jgi:hypothetical protein